VVTLGDGDTFENKLIDITNPGAWFRIEAYGSDWTIRNVGIKGEWDVPIDGHEQAISCRVDGGTGVIENVYFADGVADQSLPGLTGIYVQRKHAGTLRIDNVNIQHCPNNAIYASSMGKPEDNAQDAPPGYGGTTEITNSYAAHCQTAHFRVACTGSVVENCVAHDGDRGVWAKFEDVRVVDSDLTGHMQNRADGDVVCGTNVYPSGEDATLTLENTVSGHSAPGDQGINYPGNIQGSSADRPARTSPPAGVPQSAVEAAQGDGKSTTDAEHTLVVETADANPGMTYEFTVDGSITGGASLESSDTWTEAGGTTTATGEAGWGYSDTYTFEGDLTDWSADVDASLYSVTLDGEVLDTSQFASDDGGGRTLVVETTDDNPGMTYEFTVDGSITGGASLESSDTWTEAGGTTIATGEAGWGYSDTFEFEGELTDWSADVASDKYSVLVDGEAVDPGAVSQPQTLTVETDADGPLVLYEFTVDGTVTLGSNSEAGESVAAETVTEVDGLVEVSGATGNGYTDDYEVDGSVVDWSANVTTEDYRVLLDGESVDPTSF
jgi:hypothetical protein